MYTQVDDNVWKDDCYITKFLELFLKHQHKCGEKEEDLKECEKRLVIEHFHIFQENLTLYNIKLRMKRIREIYMIEVLELKKARKSENESKLPWFSLAARLFSHTITWENEILRDKIMGSVSSDDSPVKTSDVALVNFRREPETISSLPPTHILFSSKLATNSVSSTTRTSLPYTTSPISVDNPILYTVSQLLMTTVAFTRANSVLTTTESFSGISKRCTRTIAKFIISSPFVRIINSSKICHPFSPPTSKVTRIPLTTTSSVHFTTNTVFDPLVSPDAVSTIDRAAFSSIAVSSIQLFSTTWAECSTVDGMGTYTTTTTYSWAKVPIFTTVVASKVRLPLGSYRAEVPLSRVASTSRTRIPFSHTQTRLSPRIGTLKSTALPSRVGTLCRTGVHFPTASVFSRSNAITSASSSSPVEVLRTTAPSSTPRVHHILPCNCDLCHTWRISLASAIPLYTNRVPLSQNYSSSSADALVSAAPSSRVNVLKSIVSSSNVNDLTSATTSPIANVFRLSAPSSRANVLKSIVPSSNVNDLTSATTSPSANAFRLSAPSSRVNVLKSIVPSSNVNDLTSATTSPGANVFRSSAPSSRTDVSFSPIDPSYRNKAHLSPTHSSYRTGNFPFSLTSSSWTRDLLTDASRSKTGVSLAVSTTRTSSTSPQTIASNCISSDNGPWYI